MNSIPTVDPSSVSGVAPPYVANITKNTRVIPPAKPLIPTVEPNEQSFSEPPPFTFSAMTLSVTPDSHYIQCESPIATSYPLYQLTRNLGGNSTATGIVQISPNKSFDSNQLGTNYCTEDLLYKIYKQIHSSRTGDEGIMISAQHRQQLHGIVLTRNSGIFGTGSHGSYEARIHGKDGKSAGDLLFLGTPQKKKGGLEWRDPSGGVVAVELVTPTSGEVVVEERLQILVGLERQLMDILVAVWVARMFSVGIREDIEAAKMIKQEQELNEGRLKTKFNNVKEFLGIGYGVKSLARGYFY